MSMLSTDRLSEVIRGIWSALLHQEMAEDTDFFQAGGNSIAAIRALARFGAETGIELPLRAVFDYPTAAQLAAHIRQHDDSQLAIPNDYPEERS